MQPSCRVALVQSQLEAKKHSRSRLTDDENNQAGEEETRAGPFLDLLYSDSRRSICQSLKNAAVLLSSLFVPTGIICPPITKLSLKVA